jgi:hypothetical protein
LGQAISLWQQISQAREAVRAAPKTLGDTTKQLSALLDTMYLVEREPKLHTPDIRDVLQLLYGIAQELNQILKNMAALERKGPLRQHLHALGRRQRDEAKLNSVLGRLERTKTDLGVRMSALHVGMTGGMMDTMGRVLHGVQTVIQGRDGQVTARHHLLVEANEAGEEAEQLNGIVAVEDSRMLVTAKVTDNKAMGKSRQRNIIMSGNRSL